MTISIIGSGNTAIVLGKLLRSNGHEINEVAGRNKITVQELADELHAIAITDLKRISKNSDLYIIAVRDDAIADVAAQINLNEKIVVHACGSVSINVLKNTSANYGVLYPLQSLRKELGYTPAIPFLIDGNNDPTKQTVFNLASSLSKNIIYADDDKRLQYHLAAIIVSNFTNHLFALAKDYCDVNNIEFKLLLPLIEEVVNRLHVYAPAAMQTGPAIRGDETTMQKHIALLEKFPKLKNIYEVMSESIRNFTPNISANR